MAQKTKSTNAVVWRVIALGAGVITLAIGAASWYQNWRGKESDEEKPQQKADIPRGKKVVVILWSENVDWKDFNDDTLIFIVRQKKSGQKTSKETAISQANIHYLQTLGDILSCNTTEGALIMIRHLQPDYVVLSPEDSDTCAEEANKWARRVITRAQTI